MKILYLGILLILLVSCVTMTPTKEKPTLDMVRAQNASNLLNINIGMNKQEVLKIMGIEMIQTYYYWALGDRTRTDVISNPYRIEIKKVGNKNFEVIYYYTDIKKQDGAITNDELTPLVFENGKLIGWGWSFFEEEIKRYEIEFKER